MRLSLSRIAAALLVLNAGGSFALTPTFTKDVAPLIFQNCASCHRPGEVAPFSLLTYSDVKKKAKQVVRVTSERIMPPWKAEKGFGEFLNERHLTTQQIALLKEWFDAGAPEGDP